MSNKQTRTDSTLTHASETATLPFVSVICPTYCRRDFLPYLLYIYQYQDYPADRRELVILDDSPQSHEALVAQLTRSAQARENIRYIHHPERLSLGKKRNMLNDLAKGEYIICMDDDDYYAPDKISYTIKQMVDKKAIISGSDQILIWYSHLNKIYKTHAFGNCQAPNGTLAYHRRYLRKHRYADERVLAEEIEFLDNFKRPIQQLDPERTILCISHSENTFDKDFIMRSCTPTSLELGDVVKDKLLLAHYQRMSHAPLTSQIRWRFFEKVVVLDDINNSSTTIDRNLLDLGIQPEQIIHMPRVPNDCLTTSETLSHLAVLERAEAEAWRNYLLFDSRINFVKQEQTANNVNGLIDALSAIPWEVALFGAAYRNIQPLASLKGIVKVNLAWIACAYAVNSAYYEKLSSNIKQGLKALQESGDTQTYALDTHWNQLAIKDRWLGVYPCMGYLESVYSPKDQKQVDCTHLFFCKIKSD